MVERTPKPPILKRRFICEPTYGATRDNLFPYRPTVREVFAELFDTINPFVNAGRAVIALSFGFHLFTAGVLVFFFTNFLTPATLVFWFLSTVFMCTVFHTLWLHNYCSHTAYRFSRPLLAKIFLMTNPLFLPEAGYAVTHLYHHQYADTVGDPHGPHLGWIGSYFSVENFGKFNTDIPEAEYERMKRLVGHIGFKFNDYQTFVRTGSLENIPSFLARTVFAHTLWTGILYSLGGLPVVTAFYASIFTFSFLFRDFGWRAHGGWRKKKISGWEFDEKTYALNQRFYGYLASEWHDNHHCFPGSANYGFVPGQFQLSFHIIKGLHKIGVVKSYTDSFPEFQKMVAKRMGAKTPETSAQAKQPAPANQPR